MSAWEGGVPHRQMLCFDTPGTRVEAIRSSEGVMFYASKYICKLDTDAAESSGRFWGLHNVKEIEAPSRFRWTVSKRCG